MTYQTLYRKYRPQSFKDVVGQKNIVKILSNAVIHSKITHAYLFCGPRGTGKTSMAKIFAKVVNCENLNGVEPCNKCTSCKQIESKNFLDIIEIDAASNNGVDEIREIKNKATLAPNNGKYKVYIIDEVHMLSIGAFNALLKILEEPPAHIIFILATTEPHKLPITVISRCQRFDFRKFLNSEIEENLEEICKLENLNISSEIIKEIAVLSDGGMRDAIGLLDQLSLYDEKNISISDLYQLSGTLSISNELEFLKQYFNKNIIYCLEQLHIFERDGKNFGKITDDFLYLLEKIMKYKVISNYNDEDDLNFKSEYIELANNVSKEKLYSLISKISDVMKNIKNTSNPRILLEMIFLMEYSEEDGEKIDKKEESCFNSEVERKKQIQPIIVENNQSIPVKTEIIEENKNIESTFKNFSLSLEQVDNIKKIRINNTLALADKEILLELKNKLSLVLEYMFDENYSSIVCNLQDHILRVASETNIILSVEYPSTAQLLNEKIYLVDELLSKILSRSIKTIVVTNDEWNGIKNSYVNSKKKNIEYYLMDEENYYTGVKDSKKNEISDLEGIFGDNINDIIEIR